MSEEFTKDEAVRKQRELHEQGIYSLAIYNSKTGKWWLDIQGEVPWTVTESDYQAILKIPKYKTMHDLIIGKLPKSLIRDTIYRMWFEERMQVGKEIANPKKADVVEALWVKHKEHFLTAPVRYRKKDASEEYEKVPAPADAEFYWKGQMEMCSVKELQKLLKEPSIETVDKFLRSPIASSIFTPAEVDNPIPWFAAPILTGLASGSAFLVAHKLVNRAWDHFMEDENPPNPDEEGAPDVEIPITQEQEVTKQFLIPTVNMPMLAEKIAKLQKKAAKMGAPPITLTKIGEIDIKKVTETIDGQKHEVIEHYIEVKIEGEAPKFGGWTFMGVLEPTPTGPNILRSAPMMVIPELYRGRGTICDHCGIIRYRKETYIVHNDNGEFKQVGSTCVRDFLGGQSPYDIGRWFEWLHDAMQSAAEATYGHGELRYPLVDYLSYVAEAIKRFGFISKSKVREMQERRQEGDERDSIPPATAYRAFTAYRPPLQRERYEGWGKDYGFAPDEDSKKKAKDTIEWMKQIFSTHPSTKKESPDQIQFVNNIVVLANQETISHRDLGMTAWMVKKYNDITAPPPAQYKSEFVGAVGEKFKDIPLKLIWTFSGQSEWGSYTRYKLVDEQNRILTTIWKGQALTLNKWYKFDFKVKDHKEFRGLKETHIFYAKLKGETAVVQADNPHLLNEKEWQEAKEYFAEAYPEFAKYATYKWYDIPEDVKEEFVSWFDDMVSEYRLEMVNPSEEANTTDPKRLEELFTRLVEGVHKFKDSAVYKEFLLFSKQFRHYSFYNQMLMYWQKPNATYVAGFNKWKNEFGRYVKGGEHGIEILAPKIRKFDWLTAMVRGEKVSLRIDMLDALRAKRGTGALYRGYQLDEVLDAFEHITEAEKKAGVLGFMSVFVFDVSQTEGKPFTPPVIAPLLTNGVVTEEAYIKTIANVKEVVKVEVEEADTGVSNGFYTPSENKIQVKKTNPLDQKFKTLLHETAHALVHRENLNLTREENELVAESVAFISSDTVGLDTSQYSFGYVASWTPDEKVFETMASNIQKLSRDMIKIIEGALEIPAVDGVVITPDKTNPPEESITDKTAWNRIMERGPHLEPRATCHKLSREDLVSIFGTADYFSVNPIFQKQMNIDLLLAKFKIYDWIAMLLNGRLRGYGEDSGELYWHKYFTRIMTDAYLKAKDMRDFVRIMQTVDYEVMEPIKITWTEWSKESSDEEKWRGINPIGDAAYRYYESLIREGKSVDEAHRLRTKYVNEMRKRHETDANPDWKYMPYEALEAAYNFYLKSEVPEGLEAALREKMFAKEKKEHPKFSNEQVKQIVEDHFTKGNPWYVCTTCGRSLDDKMYCSHCKKIQKKVITFPKTSNNPEELIDTETIQKLKTGEWRKALRQVEVEVYFIETDPAHFTEESYIKKFTKDTDAARFFDGLKSMKQVRESMQPVNWSSGEPRTNLRFISVSEWWNRNLTPGHRGAIPGVPKDCVTLEWKMLAKETKEKVERYYDMLARTLHHDTGVNPFRCRILLTVPHFSTTGEKGGHPSDTRAPGAAWWLANELKCNFFLGDIPRDILDLNRKESRESKWRMRLKEMLASGKYAFLVDVHSYTPGRADRFKNLDVVPYYIPEVTSKSLATQLAKAFKSAGLKSKVMESGKHNDICVTSPIPSILIEFSEGLSDEKLKLASQAIRNALHAQSP